MKRFYYGFSFACFIVFGCCESLTAQFIGDVSVESRKLYVTPGDTLRLELEVLVRNQAVNSCQSWALVPELSTDGKQQVHFFPKVLINGKNKRQMMIRRNILTRQYWNDSPTYKIINVVEGEQTMIDYSVSVPYEDWMGDARLVLQQVLTSCNNKRQLYSVPLADEILYPYREPYDPQVLVAFCEPPAGNKFRTIKGEAFLDFQPGRSAILPAFRNNGQELGKIRAVFDQMRKDADAEITDVFVEGYASPEGAYDTNAKLALARAEALKDYLQKTYGSAESIFHVSAVGEDWSGFQTLVEESNISGKDKVLAIIGSGRTPDQKEQALKALGAPWKVLSTTIFPQLRHVDYQIKYALKGYDLAQSRILAESNPARLSQRELYSVAMSYASDTTNCHRIIDRTLELFPDDPIANINAGASLIQRGLFDDARRCLERATRSEASLEAIAATALANNMGALMLKENQLDNARTQLQRAAGAGMAEATVNLTELEKKRTDNLKLERYKQVSK